MRHSNKMAGIAMMVCWIAAMAPFFIPALNQITPKIWGMPLSLFWTYFWNAAMLVISVYAAVYIWDPFTADEDEEGKVAK